MVDVLPESPATQAGPKLFGLSNIIAFNPQNAVAPHVQFERTSSAAVKSGCGSDDFDSFIRLTVICILH